MKYWRWERPGNEARRTLQTILTQHFTMLLECVVYIVYSHASIVPSHPFLQVSAILMYMYM